MYWITHPSATIVDEGILFLTVGGESSASDVKDLSSEGAKIDAIQFCNAKEKEKQINRLHASSIL